MTAAPAGITLLRCSVNAAHSREQIDAIIQAFATEEYVSCCGVGPRRV
ncbi:hypothetical protein ACLB1R_21470 [Escherichia coli]